jgi:hypothetical protein
MKRTAAFLIVACLALASGSARAQFYLSITGAETTATGGHGLSFRRYPLWLHSLEWSYLCGRQSRRVVQKLLLVK